MFIIGDIIVSNTRRKFLIKSFIKGKFGSANTLHVVDITDNKKIYYIHSEPNGNFVGYSLTRESKINRLLK